MGLFGGIGSAIGGVFGSRSIGSSLSDQDLKSKYDKLAGSAFGKTGFGKTALSAYRSEIQKREAQQQAGSVPSVVGTAGAGNITSRVNAIENRLYAIENNTGGGSMASAPQPAAVAPAETEAAPITPAETEAVPITTPDVAGNVAAEVATGGVVPPVMQNITPAADALGQNFAASPFFMRQRNNPIMFKDQTGDGKITRADVIKARIEGYKK